MTEEEFSKVKFRMVCHLSMEDEHVATYENNNKRLGVCVHTKKKDDFTFGRSYRHYRIDGKIYRSRRKFIEALKDYNDNVKVEKLNRQVWK